MIFWVFYSQSYLHMFILNYKTTVATSVVYTRVAKRAPCALELWMIFGRWAHKINRFDRTSAICQKAGAIGADACLWRSVCHATLGPAEGGERANRPRDAGSAFLGCDGWTHPCSLVLRSPLASTEPCDLLWKSTWAASRSFERNRRVNHARKNRARDGVFGDVPKNALARVAPVGWNASADGPRRRFVGGALGAGFGSAVEARGTPRTARRARRRRWSGPGRALFASILVLVPCSPLSSCYRR